MQYGTLKLSTNTIRLATLIFGLLLSALLTSHDLPGSSSPEFWTELFTGTGTLFVLYTIPYILFTALTSKLQSSPGLVIGAAAIVALSTGIVISTFTSTAAVRPEDVPIFDFRILIVAIQIALAFIAVSTSRRAR